MPSDAENINYLYLVLTNDGQPTIDWDAVSAALDLKKSAATKRWSRLKQAMDRNEVPGGSAYQFLWLCVKHHTRAQPPNWNDIATKANTTAGAASKRYSRMKKVFEENETAPGTDASASPAKTKTTPKSTPKRSGKATTSSGDDLDDTQATPTPKRKRASPKKKTVPTDDEAKFKTEPENEDEQDDFSDTKPKRTKIGKNNIKITPKPKPKPKTVDKKEETSEDGGDPFFDAQEDLDHQDEAEEAPQSSYAVHDPEPAESLDSGDGFI